ncbi:MAG: hypothetical protein EOO25_21200, partial [Comamonadaceae bacterium]
MHKVLLVWEQGGNLGHLARLLPIAQALRDRGAEVEFVLPAGDATRSHVEAAGFPWRAVPVRMHVPGDAPAINQAEVLLRCGFGLPAGQLHALILEWRTILEASEATAAVIDASPLALYAARSLGLNAVALGHGFELPTTTAARPCFAPWLPDAAPRAARSEERLAQSLDLLADTLGVPAAPRGLGELYPHDRTALC